MIEVFSEDGKPPSGIDFEKVRAFTAKVFAALHIDEDSGLSILFCGNDYIRELNKRWRSVDEATDILSFPSESGVNNAPYLGDIAISPDKMRENAAYFQVSEDEELRRLLIHGVLHLLGYDHEHTIDNAETEPMLVLQEQLLKRLSEPIF
jgi:probable rRNA maturation factor